MGRNFNIPSRLTSTRRTKGGKLALALWVGVKFAFGNSTKYGISTKDIMEFCHCGRKKALAILNAVRQDSELFYVNEEKNCLFAKGCKDKTIKTANNKAMTQYTGDDVMTVSVPEGYLLPKDEKRFMPIAELVKLLDYLFIGKERDDLRGYKSKQGGQKAELICETNKGKSMLYIAKKVGLSRTSLSRKIQYMVNQGWVTKTEREIKRCAPGTPNAFKAYNSTTGMFYWAVCKHTDVTLTDKFPFTFRHIIWNSPKRLRSQLAKSSATLTKEIMKSHPQVSQDVLPIRLVAERQLQMRKLFD